MADTEQYEAFDFLERESGGDHHRAILWADCLGACEAAYEEFKAVEGYEDDYPSELPEEILSALKTIKDSQVKLWPSSPERNNPHDC